MPSAVRFAFFPMNRSSELSLFPFASSVGGIVVANCPFIFLISSSSFFFFFFFFFPKSESKSQNLLPTGRSVVAARRPPNALFSLLSLPSPFRVVVVVFLVVRRCVVVRTTTKGEKKRTSFTPSSSSSEGLPFPCCPSSFVGRVFSPLSFRLRLLQKSFLGQVSEKYIKFSSRKKAFFSASGRRRRRRREKKNS